MIRIEDQIKILTKRKSQLGKSLIKVPPNGGSARTVSKRILLIVLEELAQKNERKSPFRANF